MLTTIVNRWDYSSWTVASFVLVSLWLDWFSTCTNNSSTLEINKYKTNMAIFFLEFSRCVSLSVCINSIRRNCVLKRHFLNVFLLCYFYDLIYIVLSFVSSSDIAPMLFFISALQALATVVHLNTIDCVFHSHVYIFIYFLKIKKKIHFNWNENHCFVIYAK